MEKSGDSLSRRTGIALAGSERDYQACKAYLRTAITAWRIQSRKSGRRTGRPVSGAFIAEGVL